MPNDCAGHVLLHLGAQRPIGFRAERYAASRVARDAGEAGAAGDAGEAGRTP